MRALKLIFLCSLLVLLNCEISTFSADTDTIPPPLHQQIERQLIFGQAVFGNSLQLAFSHDRSKLAIVNPYALQVWDLGSKQMVGQYSFQGHGSPLKCAFSASDQEIIIRTKDKIVVWDIHSRFYTAVLDNIVAVSENLRYAAQKDAACYLEVFAIDDIDNTITTASYQKGNITFSANERYFLSLNDGNESAMVYDLAERKRVFTGKLPIKVSFRMVLSNDGTKIAAKGNPANHLLMIKLIESDSSQITTTQLTEKEQAPKEMAFDPDGNYLCMSTFAPNFKIYDSHLQQIVYEDASGAILPGKTVMDSSCFLYQNYKERFTVVLDQRTLKPIDTLDSYADVNSFYTAKDQLSWHLSGQQLFINDIVANTLDTLTLWPLYRNQRRNFRLISSRLAHHEEVIYAYPFSLFDLKTLSPISSNNLVERNSSFIPEREYGVSDRQYSPNWKYIIEDNKILECATGNTIINLPPDKLPLYDSQQKYSHSEDRLWLYSSKSSRLVIIDLVNRTILVNKTLSYHPDYLVFSPSGDYYVMSKSTDLYSLQVVSLGADIATPKWSYLYKDHYDIDDLQISLNGKLIKMRCSINSTKGQSSLWSAATGELVYQTVDRMALLPQDDEVLLWSSDSLRRVSIISGEQKWSIPFKGNYYYMTIAENGKYFTCLKDDVFHCFYDLETGKELWQLGISSDKKYFVKSSQYPIVYTNHDEFLTRFYFEDPITREAVYPLPESLRDTSEYLIQLTRQYVE